MLDSLTYNKNPFLVICNAFDMIPALKDGKSDAGAIVSFTQDIAVFKRFKQKYLWHVHDKPIRLFLISRWNEFCNKSHAKDIIEHFKKLGAANSANIKPEDYKSYPYFSIEIDGHINAWKESSLPKDYTETSLTSNQ